MRSRSITGPLILITIGLLFLLNNIWHDIPFGRMIAEYWPILLIVVGVAGLIEVLYHVGRGAPVPPRPFSGGWVPIWLIAVAAFAIWAGTRHGIHIGRLDAGGVTILGTDYTYDIAAQSPSEGITRVVFDNVHGNVTMKGEDGDGVRVSGHKVVRAFNRGDADRANEQSQIRIERQGDLLMVHSEEPAGMRMLNISADLDITLPKSLNVETRGRSGDVTIDDMGGTVDVSNSRGDVRLTNIGKDVKVESARNGLIRATGIRGNVDLRGRGGDLQLENIEGQVTINGEFSGTLEFQSIAKGMHFQSSRSDLRAAQVTGNVVLDGGEAKLNGLTGPVRFETRDRDVHVADVSDSLELTVDRGDVHVTQSKIPLPRMDITARRSGEITLALPDKAGFTIDGRAAHGEVQNDFGGDVQSQSSGHEATLKGHSGTGPVITVQTERGNINLRKN